jgi:hypothetical protein
MSTFGLPEFTSSPTNTALGTIPAHCPNRGR